MRLTARIAPYRDAIAAARQAGLTWPDVGKVLGVPPDPLRRAYLHGKKYLAEQQPLPDTKEQQPKTPQQAPPNPPVGPAGKKFFDSITKVGGNK
jgi:hypothetical protein